MAPEQLAGGPIDGRTDIFSFGVVALELATGEHPLGSNPALMLAQMMEERASLPQQLPNPALRHIIRRCLRVSPADRYGTADQLLEDLQKLRLRNRRRPAADGWWWWRFHQGMMTAVDVATPILAWAARGELAAPFRTQFFLAVLALATAAVTLRLNLLFTARVHPTTLGSHRARLSRWIAGSEAGIAALLLGAAAAIAETRPVIAAVLVSLAIVMLASLALIEPETARGARLDT